MAKIVKLSESDLTRLVKHVLKEDGYTPFKEFGFKNENEYFEKFDKADDYAMQLILDISSELTDRIMETIEYNLEPLIEEAKENFKSEYPMFTNMTDDIVSHIPTLMSSSPKKFYINKEDFYEEIIRIVDNLTD